MSLVLLASAFAFLLFLTLVVKRTLLFSAAATLLFTLAFYLLLYGVDGGILARAILHGVATAIEIGVLVLGALAFFNFLKAGNFLQQLEKGTKLFSSNPLMLTILLTLFFGSFMEGISGFGTPAMIIAPLLLALRFPAYLAASLPLVANTIPVLFGAVGTPVNIGFAGLPVEKVPVYGSLLMVLPVLVLPFFFRHFLLQEGLLSDTSSRKKNVAAMLCAGLSFAIPFVILSFTGPEFPTVLSAVIGLMIWLFCIRWIQPSGTSIKAANLLQFFYAFRPYLLIAVMMLIAKVFLRTTNLSFSWPEVGWQKTISVFQPGIVFILGTLVLYFFTPPRTPVSLRQVWQQTFSRLPTVISTIACLAILARLLSQHLEVTRFFGEKTTIPSLVFYATSVFTGVLGSFMAGSATVSNLLFGTQWLQIGHQYTLPVPLLLACQLAGAAIGNALSIQNIVMVQAVLNEKNLVSVVIRKVGKVIVLFFLLVTLAAFFIGLMIR